MSISRDEVGYLARLARLELDSAELDGLVRDLTEILAYVEHLGSPDSDAQPGPPSASTPLREDVPGASLAPGVAVASAPDRSQGLFKVPPAIGGA